MFTVFCPVELGVTPASGIDRGRVSKAGASAGGDRTKNHSRRQPPGATFEFGVWVWARHETRRPERTRWKRGLAHMWRGVPHPPDTSSNYPWKWSASAVRFKTIGLPSWRHGEKTHPSMSLGSAYGVEKHWGCV